MFRVGIVMYYVGVASTIYHDYLMRSLRPCPGGQRYCIPSGGLFDHITSAQYFCELFMWAGFALASGFAMNGWFIFGISLVNLVPRSAANHAWYLAKFDGYGDLGRAKLIPLSLVKRARKRKKSKVLLLFFSLLVCLHLQRRTKATKAASSVHYILPAASAAACAADAPDVVAVVISMPSKRPRTPSTGQCPVYPGRLVLKVPLTLFFKSLLSSCRLGPPDFGMCPL